MRMGFDEWWLVPLGTLAALALVALGVTVFVPFFNDRSADEVGRQAVTRSAVDCSGALSNDYACHQERYQNLVLDSGVEAAFAELKDEYEKNEFVKSGCHQMTHIIGRTAADLYGDVTGTFDKGDHFCGSGYYHGAMQAIVAKIGPDEMLAKADALCASLRDQQEHSIYHYNCVHGLGHGFMKIMHNELFEALEACDALSSGWEEQRCYGGVFMENTMAEVMTEYDPTYTSKYLKIDQPLYPCTDVEARYKNACYLGQTSYALRTKNGDFFKVFELCSEVEEDFRPSCYRSLGRDAATQGQQRSITDVGQTESTRMRCLVSEDFEARSNCIVGAVHSIILHHHSDRQVRTFCESLDANLRAVCLKAAEEYYQRF
jgi:hypothetical protein